MSIALRGFYKRKETEAEEYHIKLKQERELSIYQAYLISRWVWAKRLNIKEILRSLDDKPKKVMTDKEMLAQVRLLNQMFGGEEIGTEK